MAAFCGRCLEEGLPLFPWKKGRVCAACLEEHRLDAAKAAERRAEREAAAKDPDEVARRQMARALERSRSTADRVPLDSVREGKSWPIVASSGDLVTRLDSSYTLTSGLRTMAGDENWLPGDNWGWTWRW